MASAYGYITVANLEARAGIDYSAINTKYTDTVIEAQISQAERFINTLCNTSWTGTIPDAIVFITTELAYRFMYNIMVWEGDMDRENPKQRLAETSLTETEMTMISPFIVENAATRRSWINEMSSM